MPVRRLTDRSVNALKPPSSGRNDYFDAILPAFGIRVSATGAASWFVFYRIDGRQVRHVLGKYPAKGLAQARAAARGALELVQRGRDPRQEDARQRAVETKRRAETFGAVAEQYREAHLSKLARPDELWRRIESDLLPAWGATPIRDITRGGVMIVLDGIEKHSGGYARNRRLALIRNLMNFALDRELIDANPAARVRRLPETARSRVLSDTEIAEIWHAAGNLIDPFARFVRMLILTGQRRREVGEMAVAEIDIAERLWTIPAGRMKARVLHEVPLSALAMSLIQPSVGPHLFSTGRRGDLPIVGYNKIKLYLDQHIRAARGGNAQPMAAWRLHDIRRTVRSGLARLGVRPDVAERVLAHVPGGVEAVYDRFTYRDDKRRALESWAAHIERITNPQPNVVGLRR